MTVVLFSLFTLLEQLLVHSVVTFLGRLDGEDCLTRRVGSHSIKQSSSDVFQDLFRYKKREVRQAAPAAGQKQPLMATKKKNDDEDEEEKKVKKKKGRGREQIICISSYYLISSARI